MNLYVREIVVSLLKKTNHNLFYMVYMKKINLK